MKIRFKTKKEVFNVLLTIVAAVVSVAMMFYGIWNFGLKETWPELVLNLFYIASIVMILMFFFNRLKPDQFNYGCSLLVGITVLLRDILFAPPLAYYSIHLASLTLSVLLIIVLTYFYARKDWKTYSKRNLWTINTIDTLIAVLYNIDIFLEPSDQYTDYMLTEIWIRPVITYGLVACFVKGTEKEETTENQSK